MENNDKKAENRRKSMRRKPRTSIKIECRKGSTGLGANLAHSLLDISETGVRLVVAHEVPPMGEMELIVSGYGMKDAIKRLANVRWQLKLENGQYCIGVEFQKRIAYRDWQLLASPS